MAPISFHDPAVVAAALVHVAIGALWSSPLLFASAWQREAGLSDERLRQAPMACIVLRAFLAALVMAFNLAAFIGPKASLGFAVCAGLAAGLGWVAMALGVV